MRSTLNRSFRTGDFTEGYGREDLVPPPTPASLKRPGTNSGPRSRVGVCTVQNYNKSPENQDAFIASASASGTKALVAVFDGHGEQGKRVSEFARLHLAKSLFNNKDLHSNPISALESAYFDTQQNLEKNRNFDAFHSGTTAVAAYRHRDKLFIANVGDSRAVLGCCDKAGEASAISTAGLRAIELSSDQRPAREDERRRILAEGGAVHQSSYPVRQGLGGAPIFVRAGPERVWDRTGRCGLCVTRALGDVSMHPFVTAVPEISEYTLSAKDRVLVLGSDGVWDRIGSQEAVDIASKHRDPNVAAREITNLARQRWHQETQGQVSDDITTVVMHLDHDSNSNHPISTPPCTPGGFAVTASARLRSGSAGICQLPRAENIRRRPNSLGAEVSTTPIKTRLGGSQRLAPMDSIRGVSTGERLGFAIPPINENAITTTTAARRRR